jgi:ribonuclease-3
MTVDPLAMLETSIGHQFADRNILHEALSHSSHIESEHSYERLEFLGDRVLGLLLADHFYAAFPQDDEGALSLRLHGEARMSTLAADCQEFAACRLYKIAKWAGYCWQ